MSPHQFGECCLVAVVAIAAKQLRIGGRLSLGACLSSQISPSTEARIWFSSPLIMPWQGTKVPLFTLSEPDSKEVRAI
jgi:hypothetical protein